MITMEILWITRRRGGCTAATMNNRKVTVYLHDGGVWQQVTRPLTVKESEQWYVHGSEPRPVSAATAAVLDSGVAALLQGVAR